MKNLSAWAIRHPVTPIVLFVVQGQRDLASGVRIGLVTMLALAGLGLLLALVIPAVSGARLRAPDLEGWLDRGERALPSPTTAVHLRPEYCRGTKNERRQPPAQGLREKTVTQQPAGAAAATIPSHAVREQRSHPPGTPSTCRRS